MASQYKHYNVNDNNSNYTELNSEEKPYKCTAPCSCKYLDKRTDYDIMQYSNLVLNNKKMSNVLVQQQAPGWNRNKAQGLHFNPNDSNYKPIGGVGGVGWV